MPFILQFALLSPFQSRSDFLRGLVAWACLAVWVVLANVSSDHFGELTHWAFVAACREAAGHLKGVHVVADAGHWG